MSKISEEKVKKIKEQVLTELFHQGLKPLFTSEIATLLVRDEEFIKRLLLELKKDGLIKEIKKSAQGYNYSKWRRWQLTDDAYNALKQVY